MASEALDWEAMRYFLHAGRTKSLSGAARVLGVEHTTVGRRISALEQAVGGALVERGPAGLELTALGRKVHALALEMEAIAASIDQLAVAARTHVRLVVPTGFAALVVPHLAALRKASPDVSLEITSGARPVDLRRGEADLALRVGPVDDEILVARKLGEVGSALYGAKTYVARHRKPIDPDDLAGHTLVGFERSLEASPAARWLAARSDRATVVMRSREAVDMLSAAQSGVGLAVLPCFLGDAEASLVRVTPEPIASRRLSLVYRREARLSREVRAVIAFVIERMRDNAASLRGTR